MRLFLIANPVSGGDARPRIAQAAAWLQAKGVAVDVQLTAKSDERGQLPRQLAVSWGEIRLVFPNQNGRVR